jgi:hypothetical protein
MWGEGGGLGVRAPGCQEDVWSPGALQLGLLKGPEEEAGREVLPIH